MKKLVLLGLMGSLFTLGACVKEKTTVIQHDGDTTTIEHVGIDEQKVDSSAENFRAKSQEAAQKAKVKLSEVGDALKEGSKDLKREAKKVTADAASAVEKGAKDVKESVSEK